MPKRKKKLYQPTITKKHLEAQSYCFKRKIYLYPKYTKDGWKAVMQVGNKITYSQNVYTEKEIIWEEIAQLTEVMQKYEDEEEYEHALFIKKRIENLKKRLR